MRVRARTRFATSSTAVGLALLLVAGALTLAPPASAGQGIISVNQHKTPQDTSCIYAQNCDDGGVTPPFADIALYGDEVGAFAYHINAYIDGQGVHHPEKGRFCKALCRYGYEGRPKILSTDMPNVELDDVSYWLDKICDDAAISERKGRLHFEHMDHGLVEDLGNQGKCIGGYASWPPSSRDIIDLYSLTGTKCAVQMDPNFTLERGDPTGGQLEKLFWSHARTNSEPDTTVLVGFGLMGAVAAGDRLNTEPFLRGLRSHRANLIRIWAIEQWTAQAPDEVSGCSTPNQTEGPIPFEGLWVTDYDLAAPSARFYTKLRTFVQGAADRGIVVMVSLFDKHGLVQKLQQCWTGQWHHSPYSLHNNTTFPEYLEDPPGICGCSGLEGQGLGDPDENLSNCIPPDFLSDPRVVSNNDYFMRRVAKEIGGIGNVMFEIMNEMVAGEDWSVAGEGEQWQIDTADTFRAMLPDWVIRDAFNGRVGTPLLQAQVPDARPTPFNQWTADNSRIVAVVDPQTSLRLGWATSAAGTGKSAMSGSLGFASPPTWKEIDVRGDLTASSGQVRLWMSTSGGVSLEAAVDIGAGELRLYRIEPWPGGGMGPAPIVTLLGSAPLASPTAPHNVRLALVKLEEVPDYPLISVYIDSSLPATLRNLNAGSIADISRVGFSGWNGSIPYPANVGKVDNFEAAYYSVPW